MGLLEGKKGLILGVANNKSIAWSIARELHKEGAELAFSYAGERLEERVRILAGSIGAGLLIPCDVTRDEDIDSLFGKIREEWGALDILVHSIAFANKDELKGAFVDTTRQGFALAMDVSAYSLIAMARGAYPLMESNGGKIITMTYLGGRKVIPNYNVMGVAKAGLEASVKYLAADLGPKGINVNAVSAGPIKTLAAMGISGFKEILGHIQDRSPLKRNITAEEVAKTALYLLSDLSSGVTGETIYVDAGYNIIGM